MMARTRDALVVAMLALAVMALFDEWIWPPTLPMPIDGASGQAHAASMPDDAVHCTVTPPPSPPSHYARRRMLPPDPRSMT